ncbi:M48 family metallopeptidase [Tropicibacter sp. Alg240-R139]|uniref:tetratricopeptide repeat protein n=1 Tax=Tropicibacter sp. Alg240-R139 TaxID=2305991 RepID=UPI0013E0AFCD|nr:hypothetical protein [Tropicibacter sp. Alg240-R139]
MPTPSATSRSRNWANLDSIRAALVCAALALGGPTSARAEETSHTLTLDQAYQAAIEALRIGQPDVTVALTHGLLQASPKNPVLHYLQATAYARMNEPEEGRQAATLAYRNSKQQEALFQSAQLAARLSLQAGRPTMAQFWLRRTAVHAPNEKAKELIAADYKQLRRINPWAFRIRAEIKPTDNVNNGADTALQIIDGVPVVGQLSGSAQALSGVFGIVDVTSAYRLRQSADSMTSVGGRLYVQRVSLSSEAKALAPDITGSQFASTYGEISVRHAMIVGPAENLGSAAVDVATGTSWFGGERSYNFARLGGERTWRMAGGAQLRLNAMVETRFAERYGTNDANIVGIGAQYLRPVGQGNRISVSMAYRDSRARWFTGTYRAASVRVAYDLGQAIGPAKLSAGLVLGYSDYPEYAVSIFAVPGGRQDTSIYGDLSLFFDKYDYAGFAPMLRVRTGKKDSNVSRFDIREFSVSLGIESKF